MAKKIVLIKPRNEALDIYYDLPLGLLQVGTLPKKAGYKVKIIDCVLVKNYLKAIESECKDAFVVGITVNTAQVRGAIKISDFIKERFDIPVVWGGWHPTLFPEQTCADKAVDFVVIKEGDYTLFELVKAIDLNLPLSNIKGIVYKKNGSVVFTGYREDLNMDELFLTDYELIDIKTYIKNRSGTIAIEYQSSRGCPYNCQFCINIATKNQKYRAKSPEKVLDEIEFLVKNYSINYINFIDDNTFVDIRRVREIAKGLVERKLNVKWYGECRANYFRDGFVDNDFLDLAVKSGLSGLTIGAESGSERILKMMDKAITTEQIINSAKVLSKYKEILPVYSFIIGVPNETRKDIGDTLNIVKRIRNLCPHLAFGITSLRAYPRSGLTQQLIENGFIKEPQSLKDWLQDKFVKLYIGSDWQPWQEDKELIYNISSFAKLGYATFGDSEIKKILKSPKRWYLLFDLTFVYLARFRIDNLFFFLPIDRFIYRLFRKIRSFIIDNLFIKNYSYRA